MHEKLKEIREKKGYTIIDVARVIGKSPCNYYKKETGDVAFSLSEALKIANFFKCNVEKIFPKEEFSESGRWKLEIMKKATQNKKTSWRYRISYQEEKNLLNFF